jgi:hypothetical protein
MSEEIVTPEVEVEASAEAEDSFESAEESTEEGSYEEDSGESIEVQAETTEELQEELQEAIDEGASEEEIKDMIKEFTLKVNGKEVKKSLDLGDEDAVRRELQLAAAGRDAMQRSRELEKLYTQEIERLKEDPWSVLKELDLDPDELAEQRIRAKIEEMQKSPEQIESERIRKELEETRQKLKAKEEEANSARMAQLEEQEAVKLNREITDALDAHKTLPKSQKTVARIADALMWAYDNGFEDATVSDVIPSVEAEIRSELKQFMSDMPEEMLETYIGKKNIERLRKKRVNNIKSETLKNVKPVAKEASNSEKKAKKSTKARDYFRNL